MIVILPITCEKNVITLPCEMQNSFVWWKEYCFPPNVDGCEKVSCVVWHWWLWKEPVVLCGNLNVMPATSQQLFKVTTVCMETRVQSFLPLINHIVHHAVLKYSLCLNKPLPQLMHIVDWYLGYTLLHHAANQLGLGLECWLVTCQDW